MSHKKCRFCGENLKFSFVNLGMSPLSNSFLNSEQLNKMEPFFPLRAYVCDGCFLVQLEEFESPKNIFSNYSYFSSYSDTWLMHAETYVKQMIDRFRFNASSQVIEVASNDGYLLQYFKERGIPVLGIEPAENVAKIAEKAGIPTIVNFFGVQTALEQASLGKRADLLLGNNVLAHVPDLNDFVKGLKILLKPLGIITLEFPHLKRLLEQNQFDTIYHEHFSYFSFMTVEKIFASHGLIIFDVEELPTHGGSLRIYVKHSENTSHPLNSRIYDLKKMEMQFGLNKIETYFDFEAKVREIKRNLLDFLIHAKRDGKSIVGYGAPAKGNTLLNYCGIRTDFIDYTVDRNPHKQYLFLPGTHIPINHIDKILETKPDYLLILPWNLKEEIIKQMGYIRNWGGKFVIPVPEISIIS